MDSGLTLIGRPGRAYLDDVSMMGVVTERFDSLGDSATPPLSRFASLKKPFRSVGCRSSSLPLRRRETFNGCVRRRLNCQGAEGLRDPMRFPIPGTLAILTAERKCYPAVLDSDLAHVRFVTQAVGAIDTCNCIHRNRPPAGCLFAAEIGRPQCGYESRLATVCLIGCPI